MGGGRENKTILPYFNVSGKAGVDDKYTVSLRVVFVDRILILFFTENIILQ